MLVDENVSPKTAKLLEKLGCDVKTVFDFNLQGSKDSELAERALKENRVIITLDSSFGYRYYFINKGKIGIILLRLSNLSVENVNSKLKNLFDSVDLKKEDIVKSLMILDDVGFRVLK